MDNIIHHKGFRRKVKIQINDKNNKKQNIASDIITSVNNKNKMKKLDLVEEEEQVEVDNSDKELSGSNTSENVRSQLLSNEIVEREPDVKNCLFVPGANQFRLV